MAQVGNFLCVIKAIINFLTMNFIVSIDSVKLSSFKVLKIRCLICIGSTMGGVLAIAAI